MKKIGKNLLLGLLIIALFAFSAGCSSGDLDDSTQSPAENNNDSAQAPAQDNPTIGILQYISHGALDEAREGFIAGLADNGYVDGENITIDYQNAQGDQSNLSTISDRFVNDQVDLVLAIATPAAQAIAGKTTELPILATAVTDYVVARLVDSNEAPGGNVSGTTDMNPVKEQIELLVEFVPDAKTIGVLYTSSEDNSILQAELAKEAIEGLGLNYVEVTVTNSNDVQQATQSIVAQCDAIYIPTDNVFSSAMPVVHGVTSESKTPVVCGETGMTQVGGIATLGTSYYELGYQTGEMAVKILKGEAEPATMPIESAKSFEYYVNGAIVEELGIKVPAKYEQYIQ